MSSGSLKRNRKQNHDKALRCLKLWERGHSLLAIAELCNIPSGSVTKRIELGKRLKSLTE